MTTDLFCTRCGRQVARKASVPTRLGPPSESPTACTEAETEAAGVMSGECESCGASEVACENIRWLSPRRCCPNCSHEPTESMRRPPPGGRGRSSTRTSFDPAPWKLFSPQ